MSEALFFFFSSEVQEKQEGKINTPNNFVLMHWGVLFLLNNLLVD